MPFDGISDGEGLSNVRLFLGSGGDREPRVSLTSACVMSKRLWAWSSRGCPAGRGGRGRRGVSGSLCGHGPGVARLPAPVVEHDPGVCTAVTSGRWPTCPLTCGAWWSVCGSGAWCAPRWSAVVPSGAGSWCGAALPAAHRSSGQSGRLGGARVGGVDGRRNLTATGTHSFWVTDPHLAAGPNLPNGHWTELGDITAGISSKKD